MDSQAVYYAVQAEHRLSSSIVFTFPPFVYLFSSSTLLFLALCLLRPLSEAQKPVT